jgi:hypothetical protein
MTPTTSTMIAMMFTSTSTELSIVHNYSVFFYCSNSRLLCGLSAMLVGNNNQTTGPLPMEVVKPGDEWDYDNSDDDADFICDEKPWPDPADLYKAAGNLKLPERKLGEKGESSFGFDEFDFAKYDYPTCRDMPNYDPDKLRARGVHWNCDHDMDELPADIPIDKPLNDEEFLDEHGYDPPDGCVFNNEDPLFILQVSGYSDMEMKRADSIALEDDAPRGLATKNGFVMSTDVKYAREPGQIFIDKPPSPKGRFFAFGYASALPYENVHLWHGQLIRRNPTRKCRYKQVYPLCPRKVRQVTVQ